ncbi:MAG: tRNA (guanine(46)-N(7))-methyltransferase TrmB [Alphaproteobacteria bacterium]|nr:tRNA (guanine(46)-N(7))-methyltransferase TrmB [Alphaproteobacteria bacterium]
MEKAKNSLIRTFGRVRGKTLSDRKQWLVENLLPALAPTKNDQDAILEIGFGAGEHILHLAETHPTRTIIGAEPFMNGVAALLSHMTDDVGAHTCAPGREYAPLQIIKPEYKNIKIWPDDVRKLLSMPYALCPMPYFAFSKIYILHPDPWPKSRHEKRRLLQTEFLNELAGRLAPGGQIIIATDHLDYFDWILEKAAKTNLKISNKDFSTPPESGLDTRYKTKDMFGKNTVKYLILTHKA